MKNLVNTESFKAVTVADVEAQVKAELTQNGFIVVEDKAAAEQFFKDNFEEEGYVGSETAQQFDIISEVDGGWATTTTVKIEAHYIDAGSDDYVYTVTVTED